MKVSEVMTQAVRSCAPGTNLAAAAMEMWEGDCGFLPVVEDGVVVGVITDRDICMAAATHSVPASSIEVREVMSREVSSCAPTDATAAVLARMAHDQVRRLPVVTRGGKLAGVVSMNDLVLEARARRGANEAPTHGEVVGALQEVCRHRQLPVAS